MVHESQTRSHARHKLRPGSVRQISKFRACLDLFDPFCLRNLQTKATCRTTECSRSKTCHPVEEIYGETYIMIMQQLYANWRCIQHSIVFVTTNNTSWLGLLHIMNPTWVFCCRSARARAIAESVAAHSPLVAVLQGKSYVYARPVDPVDCTFRRSKSVWPCLRLETNVLAV